MSYILWKLLIWRFISAIRKHFLSILRGVTFLLTQWDAYMNSNLHCVVFKSSARQLFALNFVLWPILWPLSYKPNPGCSLFTFQNLRLAILRVPLLSCQQSGEQPVLVAIILTNTEKLFSLCEVHYKKVLAALTTAAVGSLNRSIRKASLFLKGGNSSPGFCWAWAPAQAWIASLLRNESGWL